MEAGEEAVKAAHEAARVRDIRDERTMRERIVDALTAALPHLPGVGVKKLEWTKGVVDIASPLPGMKYVACSTTPKGSWAFWLDGAPESRAVLPSEAEAKSAAQADFHRRVSSMIEVGETKADPWVDTRLVRFDDTIVFGKGGFDFDRWESLRWEMHTRHGSFAVWKSGSKTWSMYGGKYGHLMLDRFSSEENAKAEAEQIVISFDAEPRATPVAPVSPTHRHKKRGTHYSLIGVGRMQTDSWHEPMEETTTGSVSVDLHSVAIYRSVDDSSLWVRPTEEFEDGRFETLPVAVSPDATDKCGELERYGQNWHDEMEPNKDGEYVRFDQAVELLAAKDKEIKACHENINLKADFIEKTIGQLHEAEADNAARNEGLDHDKIMSHVNSYGTTHEEDPRRLYTKCQLDLAIRLSSKSNIRNPEVGELETVIVSYGNKLVARSQAEAIIAAKDQLISDQAEQLQSAALVIDDLQTKLAAAEKALEAIEDHATRCFSLSTHSTTALAYLKDIQDEARAALGGKPS